MTPKERARLRGLANGIDTVLQIGKDGIGETLIRQADITLETRELIKGRVLDACMDHTPRTAAEALARATHSEVVQVIGSKFVLYRERKAERSEKRARKPETSDKRPRKAASFGKRVRKAETPTRDGGASQRPNPRNGGASRKPASRNDNASRKPAPRNTHAPGKPVSQNGGASGKHLLRNGGASRKPAPRNDNASRKFAPRNAHA
ncbi:MAG: YhbY family RNA-binding protein, partial [Oscillibacter sp.]|nr:YhbY family RNA-binding protein [Oscillibacter sp.]